MTIIFRGGEDFEYSFASNSTLTQTAGWFRAGYARCALQPGNTGNPAIKNLIPWSPASSSFWFTSWMTSNNFNNTNGNVILWFYDASNNIRFYVVATGTNTYQVFKRTAGGVATSLGTFSTSWAANVLYKIDVQVVGGVSGSFNIYQTPNGGSNSQIFAFSGDTTTDGAAQAISYHGFGDGLSGQVAYGWSEPIAATTDTRAMSLVTLAPVANGNTHNFDTGSPAAANVNEVVLNDATLDGSSTAGQIDQYTIPALPAGTWQIIDFAVSARMLSNSGPAHMDIGVRAGSTPADYWSADIALTAVFTIYQNDWPTDPSTSAQWTGLPVNIGLRSVT